MLFRKKSYSKITPSGRKNFNKRFSSTPLRLRMYEKKVPYRHNAKTFIKRIKIK